MPLFFDIDTSPTYLVTHAATFRMKGYLCTTSKPVVIACHIRKMNTKNQVRRQRLIKKVRDIRDRVV
uniref:Protein YLS2-like n=1 Tax=Rhizophora mucronata TaxID=61149 RepID=A0A2P2K040_RHIMU